MGLIMRDKSAKLDYFFHGTDNQIEIQYHYILTFSSLNNTLFSLWHTTCKKYCVFWKCNGLCKLHFTCTTRHWKPVLIWWRHQMETFTALLAICAGNSPVNSPHKGQWRGALMFSLICTRINGWVNNGEASDLRRHCAHYDVTVLKSQDLSVVGVKPFPANQNVKYECFHCASLIFHVLPVVLNRFVFSVMNIQMRIHWRHYRTFNIFGVLVR